MPPGPLPRKRRPRSPAVRGRPDARPPEARTTTFWSFPSRNYGGGRQGSDAFRGAAPAGVVWNLLHRYTRPNDLVVDPMAGSGTVLDVARDLGRRALGYDLAPVRPDIFRADARKLPLEDGKADYVFVDPPYSTHLKYSDDPRCLGRLSASESAYYEALDAVIGEIDRILRPDRGCALYVSDSFVKGKGFYPIGFEAFARLRRRFVPVDWVVVERHGRTLDMENYRSAAAEGNFFLRGFNHLLLFRKPAR